MSSPQFYTLVTILPPLAACLVGILLSRRRAAQPWLALIFFSIADASVLAGVETPLYARLVTMLSQDTQAFAISYYLVFLGLLAKQGQMVGKGASVQHVLTMAIAASTRLTSLLRGLAQNP